MWPRLLKSDFFGLLTADRWPPEILNRVFFFSSLPLVACETALSRQCLLKSNDMYNNNICWVQALTFDLEVRLLDYLLVTESGGSFNHHYAGLHWHRSPYLGPCAHKPLDCTEILVPRNSGGIRYVGHPKLHKPILSIGSNHALCHPLLAITNREGSHFNVWNQGGDAAKVIMILVWNPRKRWSKNYNDSNACFRGTT